MSRRLVEQAARQLALTFPEMAPSSWEPILCRLAAAAKHRAANPFQPLDDAFDALWQAVESLRARLSRQPNSATDGQPPRPGSFSGMQDRPLAGEVPPSAVGPNTAAATVAAAAAYPQQGSLVRLVCELLAERLPEEHRRREAFRAALVADVFGRPQGRAELWEDELEEIWEALRVLREVADQVRTPAPTRDLPRWLKAT